MNLNSAPAWPADGSQHQNAENLPERRPHQGCSLLAAIWTSMCFGAFRASDANLPAFHFSHVYFYPHFCLEVTKSSSRLLASLSILDLHAAPVMCVVSTTNTRFFIFFLACLFVCCVFFPPPNPVASVISPRLCCSAAVPPSLRL